VVIPGAVPKELGELKKGKDYFLANRSLDFIDQILGLGFCRHESNHHSNMSLQEFRFQGKSKADLCIMRCAANEMKWALGSNQKVLLISGDRDMSVSHDKFGVPLFRLPPNRQFPFKHGHKVADIGPTQKKATEECKKRMAPRLLKESSVRKQNREAWGKAKFVEHTTQSNSSHRITSSNSSRHNEKSNYHRPANSNSNRSANSSSRRHHGNSHRSRRRSRSRSPIGDERGDRRYPRGKRERQ
jgi:hypothetical protein